MKTLFLAAAAVLAIGAGSAYAESGEVYSWDQAPKSHQMSQTAPMTTAGTQLPVAYVATFNGNG
jgi:hypothetical protein